MQYSLFPYTPDFSEKKVLIGLSGGINSMAVLAYLSEFPNEKKPREVHLFYAHFKEHSPDTLEFVLDGVSFAKKHFDIVYYTQTDNSVIDFFREQKMTPHPMFAPCTRILKSMPLAKYAKENNIDIDLVGYVREEKNRRIKNMHAKNPETKETKDFLIADFSNEWCFWIVKKTIGWYPKIYDIRNKKGERIFKHNNCLPCKNMTVAQMKDVEKHYPEYFQEAMNLSSELKKSWGRNVDAFYTEFGRQDYEVDYKEQVCEVCAFE